MNRRNRRLAGGAAALGAGAILIGPITALAQSDDDPPASTTPATTDAGTDEGTDEGTDAPAPDDEEQAAKPDVASRLAEVLQPLVDAGTITQAQLDAVMQALQDAGPVFGGRHGGPRGDWGGGGPGRFGARISLEAAATAIGISEDDLRAALEDGQTLAEVATANSVEPQAVVDALVAEAETRLDEAVAAGRLDEAAADERLAEITERITTAVEDGFPTKVGRGRWGDHDADRAEPTPTDDPTPADESPATTETTPPTTDGGS